MANIKSSEKANRQRIKRTRVNHARKSAMRTAIKKVQSALGGNDTAEAQKNLAAAVRLIDRTGGRGTIKKGTASRLVSRLTKSVNRAIAAR